MLKHPIEFDKPDPLRGTGNLVELKSPNTERPFSLRTLLIIDTASKELIVARCKGSWGWVSHLFWLLFYLISPLDAQTSNSDSEAQPRSPTATVSGIEHVIWVWFENRDSTAITPQTAPYFTSFAATYANLTNFNGVSHPSQPNYLDAFSGSNQGITGDGYCTFPASTDNLAKQLAVAGKSWRVFAQDYPGNCSDLQTSTGGVDGAGVAGTYVRKHNPAMGFESVRLDPVQCANIQALANFDPTVNFALVVPNLTNDMHDGTTGQGDTFLQAFVPTGNGEPGLGAYSSHRYF